MKLNKFILIATLLLIPFNISLAKPTGGFSSGSRPSSSFSSSKPSGGFSSSSKPSSSWSSSKPSSSTWGSSKPAGNGFSSAKTTPSVDASTFSKAKASGTVFTNKEAAAHDFQAKYSQKYTSSFKEEPKSRPSYIPQSYSDGGKSYNITYNVNQGGYGYNNSLGMWIAYDLMRDSMMRDRVMVEHNYYTEDDAPSGGHPVLSCIIGIIVIIVIVCIVVRICSDPYA